TETYRRINDEYPIGRTRLLGCVLSSIRTVCGGRATILTVSREDLARTGTTVEDTENLVQFGLSIQGVAATVLLTDIEEGVKLSFRSRGSVSVQPLARALGGGGHAFAAGATLRGATIDEATRRMLPLLCALFEGETQGPVAASAAV
ncbi:MAG: DHHA1 domain-containing protein, partial [Bacteroidota bacterium]|nr:DHHA1 domain-containing protein [Bacteroidota bacterium]